MEKMPYQQERDGQDVRFRQHVTVRPVTNAVSTDWRERLPLLAGATVTLRELRASDAPSLFALLTTEEVSRFISPPPNTVDGFEKFIAWTLRQRSVGSYVCFAVTIDATDTAIGIFQLRQLEPGFGTAEWGFAIGSAYWGTGVFQEGAELLVSFAFETVGVHRLEARAVVQNGRALAYSMANLDGRSNSCARDTPWHATTTSKRAVSKTTPCTLRPRVSSSRAASRAGSLARTDYSRCRW